MSIRKWFFLMKASLRLNAGKFLKNNVLKDLQLRVECTLLTPAPGVLREMVQHGAIKTASGG